MRRALVVLVLVAACSDDAEETAAKFCVDETNRYREMHGLVDLVRSSKLEAFAKEGAEVDFFSSPHDHFGSDGGGVALAENECPQQGGWTVAAGEDVKDVVGQCVKAFYDEGPGGGHYENLMGPYTKLGCGTYEEEGLITIVQDFGN